MNGLEALYPDFRTVALNELELAQAVVPYTRRLPPITTAEVLAYTPPSPPACARPAITAYKGADLDAYWFDCGIWRHCQSGNVWPGASS